MAGWPGFLKAYFDVNEILSTIMLNQIAVQMMNFLLNGILLDPAEAGFNNIPKTARLVTAAQLPRISLPIGDPWLFARTRLHWGLIIAIVAGGDHLHLSCGAPPGAIAFGRSARTSAPPVTPASM